MNETETFQHYQVLRREDGTLWELGRGAMGVTYKAFDVNLRCEVALKVISSQHLDSEMARARFLREARAAAALRHRNVASVYHLGNDADSFFYSMEFIDGQTVESLVQSQGSLSCVDALQIIHQAARALGAAARQGLVHRDIKPANLMVVHEDEDEDEGFVVKVIDFGLARPALDGRQSGHITMGGFVGTPQYASPEQIEERDLDTRSDLYSLGITLWYMLVGQPPFTGSVFQISTKHLTAEPPWDRLGTSLPEPVRALLEHMLQKDPANRPQTPAKLRAEIDECLRQLSVDPAAPPGDRPLAAMLPDHPAPVAAIPTAQPPGEPAEPESAAANVTVVQGPAPKAGTIFAGRYQLAERVAEGTGGEVYRAFDGREDGRMVAVKVLRIGLGLSPNEFYHLQGDLGRLRFAPHPNLIDTYALERIHGYKYCVMQWLCGFTLRDLLRVQGPLRLRDALNLVGQASDAASHCSANRFHRLELALHQAMVHFPTLASDDKPPPDFGPILAQPPSEWPTFQLKLDALDPTHEGSSAPAGPTPRMAGRDTHTSIRGLVESSYFHALGQLCYALLSGSAPGVDETEAITPLTALSAEGNAVLRRALSTNPGFGNENEFFSALLATTGLRREEIGLPRALVEELPTVARAPATPSRVPESVQARVTAPPPPPVDDPTKSASPPSERASITATPPVPVPAVFVPPLVPPVPLIEAKVVVPAVEPPAPPVVEPVVVRHAPALRVAEPALSQPPVPTPVREAEPSVSLSPEVGPLPETTPVATELPAPADEEPTPIPAEAALAPSVVAPDPVPSVPLSPPPTARLDGHPPADAAPKKKPPVAMLVLAAVVVVGAFGTWTLLKSPHPSSHPNPVASPSAPSASKVSPAPPAADSGPSKTVLSAPPASPTPAPSTLAETIPPGPSPAPAVAVPAADLPPVVVSATPTPPPNAVPLDTPRPTDPPVVQAVPTPTPAPSAEAPRPTVRDAKPSPRPTVSRGAAPTPPKALPKPTVKPTPKPTPRAVVKPTPPRNGDDTPPGFMR